MPKHIPNEKKQTFKRLLSDHGKEFTNNMFNDFCEGCEIKQEFIAPKTPQQNGIAETKN